MVGVMFSDKEAAEIAYLLKRELEEILVDVKDGRLEETVKLVMKEKYMLVYGLYKRFTHPAEWSRYAISIDTFKTNNVDESG